MASRCRIARVHRWGPMPCANGKNGSNTTISDRASPACFLCRFWLTSFPSGLRGEGDSFNLAHLERVALMAALGGMLMAGMGRKLPLAIACKPATPPLSPRLARVLFVPVLTHLFSLCGKRGGRLTRFASPGGWSDGACSRASPRSLFVPLSSQSIRRRFKGRYL